MSMPGTIMAKLQCIQLQVGGVVMQGYWQSLVEMSKQRRMMGGLHYIQPHGKGMLMPPGYWPCLVVMSMKGRMVGWLQCIQLPSQHMAMQSGHWQSEVEKTSMEKLQCTSAQGIDAIRTLVELGGNVNAVNKRGKTPMNTCDGVCSWNERNKRTVAATCFVQRWERERENRRTRDNGRWLLSTRGASPSRNLPFRDNTAGESCCTNTKHKLAVSKKLEASVEKK